MLSFAGQNDFLMAGFYNVAIVADDNFNVL